MKNLPKGWEIKKLGDVCRIIMGQSPASETYSDVDNFIPFFQGKAEFTDLYPIPKKYCTKPTKIAEPLDILLSVRAPVGTTNIANQRCCIGRGLSALRFENYKFGFYFLRSIQQELDSKGTGTTFRAISGEVIREALIPYPPLETQQRIVSKIDELFSELEKGVEELKKSLEQLKVYCQSVLKWAFEGRFTSGAGIESVIAIGLESGAREGTGTSRDLSVRARGELPEGWEWKSLNDIIEISKNKYNPTETRLLFYVGLEHIEKNTGSLIVKDNFEEIKTLKNQFYKGELLYDKLRPNLNKVYLAKEDGVCSTDILVLKTKGNCDLQFLKYLMLGSEFVNEMSENTNGVNLPRVSTKFILEYQIKIPKLNEQHQIVQEIESRLSVADKMEEQIKTSLQQAEALKQSILKKAFSGELRTGRDLSVL